MKLLEANIYHIATAVQLSELKNHMTDTEAIDVMTLLAILHSQ